MSINTIMHGNVPRPDASVINKNATTHHSIIFNIFSNTLLEYIIH